LGIAPSRATEVDGATTGAPVRAPISAETASPVAAPVPAARDAGDDEATDASGRPDTGSKLQVGDAAIRPEPRFGTATRVVELASDVEDDNPTLTDDLLQIYFTSRREGGPGNADVWFAERASVDEAFSEPRPVDAASTSEFDSSPAISPDGLTLWTAIDVEGGLGGLDIWATARPTRGDAWSLLTNVAELNSSEDDLPRPVGDNGRLMPIQSRRDDDTYRIYLASRGSDSEPFGTPTLLAGLVMEGNATGDGFVTNDGLGFYFAYSAEELGDLYFAWRANRDEDFAEPVALTTLNTDADERDPWLSNDGTRFFFSSSRDGNLDIYEARVDGRGGP
jgi:hypothetical protein